MDQKWEPYKLSQKEKVGLYKSHNNTCEKKKKEKKKTMTSTLDHRLLYKFAYPSTNNLVSKVSDVGMQTLYFVAFLKKKIPTLA